MICMSLQLLRAIWSAASQDHDMASHEQAPQLPLMHQFMGEDLLCRLHPSQISQCASTRKTCCASSPDHLVQAALVAQRQADVS